MGYQIFYGMGLCSRVLGVQDLDAMNVYQVLLFLNNHYLTE